MRLKWNKLSSLDLAFLFIPPHFKSLGKWNLLAVTARLVLLLFVLRVFHFKTLRAMNEMWTFELTQFENRMGILDKNLQRNDIHALWKGKIWHFQLYWNLKQKVSKILDTHSFVSTPPTHRHDTCHHKFWKSIWLSFLHRTQISPWTFFFFSDSATKCQFVICLFTDWLLSPSDHLSSWKSVSVHINL